MHFDFIGALDATYGNALAAGGGFHRVTMVDDGAAAELATQSFLWYKLVAFASSEHQQQAIVDLWIGETAPTDGFQWIRMDKAIDRTQARFVFYRLEPLHADMTALPLKDIRAIADRQNVPDEYEVVSTPFMRMDASGKAVETFLCFRRLSPEEFAGKTWSIKSQKAGNWIEVRDLSTANRWHIAQIMSMSTSEVRVQISTWRKPREEYVARAACRPDRVAKLGTHTNIHLSPSYPFTRKQGSPWNVGMRDLHEARAQFDALFFELSKRDEYLTVTLLPFIEKSMLCTFYSNELADEFNRFHQHVIKNVVAAIISDATTADGTMLRLLALLRILLNGFQGGCMFFYLKYTGNYASEKSQKLVYTSYLSNAEALSSVPTRHPCRSMYFVENVELFFQAGGFRLMLERMEAREVALTEVALFCSLLLQAKPCIVEQRRKQQSRYLNNRSSTVDTQVEEFFREFMNAVFARLRRMNDVELKDDDGIIDHLVSSLDLLYRDQVLLGDGNTSFEDDDSAGSAFAEVLELFQLDLAKKLICCPFLSQRMLGLSRLNDMIQMALRKETLQKKTSLSLKRSGSDSVHAGGVTKWLRTKYLGEWLAASDVLEVILGDREVCGKYGLHEGIHLELLKRSKGILEFGELNDSHIKLLWKSAMKQLRSGRKAIFDLVLALCETLDAELIDVLVVLITQVELVDYDDLVVQFIRRIIAVASSRLFEKADGGSKRTSSFGSLVGSSARSKSGSNADTKRDSDVLNKVIGLCCTLLWNGIVQDAEASDGSTDLLREELEGALADALNHIQQLSTTAGSDQHQYLSQYLQKCAENIKTGVLVETSMHLIRHIADGYGTNASSSSSSSLKPSFLSSTTSSTVAATASELLRDLDTKFGIATAVVQEIQAYMKQAKAKGLDRLPILASNHPDRNQPNAHQVAMETRLSFLGYLTIKSELEISLAAMEDLWLSFHGPDSTLEERDVLFRWLASVFPDPNDFVQRAYAGKSAFSSSVIEELFYLLTTPSSSTKKIVLDVTNMSSSAFWACERLFRLVNANERRLICNANATADSKNALMQVESTHLKGIETLYAIALTASSDLVSDDAINYLIYLHLHVGSKLVRREVWMEFVTGCIRRLHDAKSLEDGGRQAHRLLRMIGTFLHQSTVPGAVTGSTNAAQVTADAAEELTVYVRYQDGRAAAPFRYMMKRTSLVSELRSMIAQDTNHPGERVRIVNEFKTKLTAQGHDKFTLEKARVFDSQRKHYVEAVLLSKVENDTVGHVERRLTEFGSLRGAAGTGAVGIDSDWQACKHELASRHESLHLLLYLLSYGKGIAEEAWKVLKLLTPDAQFEKRVRTLDEALAIDGKIRKPDVSFDWKSLLDPVCAPKLLYQLEFVERFALCGNGRPLPSDDVEEVENEGSQAHVDGMVGVVNEWSRSFLKLGGRAHLEAFLLTSSPRQLIAQGPLAVMCLSKLLKLLRHFVLVEAQDQALEHRNPTSVLHQVFEALSCVQALHEAEQELGLAALVEQPNLQSLSVESQLAIQSYAQPVIRDPENVTNLPFEAHLVVRALSFVSSSLLMSQSSSMDLLQAHSQHSIILLKCLMDLRFKQVRQEAANVVAALSTTRNKNKADRVVCCQYFLKLLGEYDGTVSDEEYYNVYTLLIASAEDLTEFDFIHATRRLCRRIKAFQIPSDHQTKKLNPPKAEDVPSAPDSLLEALLATLLSIVKRIPATLAGELVPGQLGRTLRDVIASTLHQDEGLLDELFSRCLFATSVDEKPAETVNLFLEQPKCRSESCRDVAFSLLKELSIENTKGLQFLLVQMARQHSLTPLPEPKSTGVGTPLAKKKRKQAKDPSQHLTMARSKYVGLKNLGCTCYMNSTLQAFFMMPGFRRQILRCQSPSEDSLVYQLQSLFAHLEASAKPYYNPKAFTAALKTWDGESIDVNLQQDASEFLTSFFQQIESELNGVSTHHSSSSSSFHGEEHVLHRFFGGVFSNELVAEGGRYSERLEPFHFISVPVRDRKNLNESLESWIEGDKVSYTWENEDNNEKVTLETHKRISIQQLPEYLIIHLKRFEFDFEAMQQIKLHDRFEFPMELDMYPFTKEAQQAQRKQESSVSRTTAPESSQYELVGTVVHMGTAHSGHYYSFLREQETVSLSPQWYEFNDTLVTPFDPNDIAEECFGGEDRSVQGLSGSSPSRMKNRSSFMLMYARTRPKPIDLSTSPVRKSRHSIRSMAIVARVLLFCVHVRHRAAGRLAFLRERTAPTKILDVIAMENRQFWRKKYLYDARCVQFTFNLIQTCLVSSAQTMRFEPIEIRLEALQMATKFVFGTLWQVEDVNQVLAWKPALQALYHEEIEGCKWFLTEMCGNPTLLLDLLVSNEHSEVRDLMAMVLTEAIATTSRAECAEETEYHTTRSMVGAAPPTLLDETPTLPASFEFIFQLITLMPALLMVPVDHHRQYFSLVLDFIQTGRNECAFLVVNNVIGAIVALMTGIGATQPLLAHEFKRTKDKHILKCIEMNVPLLRLLSLLVRSADPPACDVENPVLSPHMAQDHMLLPDADRQVLVNERFIVLLIQRANHYTKETKLLEQIITHLCWESQRVTAVFLDKIMHGIETEDHYDVKPYFRTLNTLFKLRDSLVQRRLQDGLTKLLAVMASQQRYYKATETSIEMLTRLAKRHSKVVQWLRANPQSFAWMEKWLLEHRGPDGLLQQFKTSLVKPNSTSSWVSVPVGSPGLLKSIDRMVGRLVPRLRALSSPDSPMESFYDSDDNPQRLVGKRIRVKWAKDKWYDGTVERFNEETYEHFVVYDDGDKRNYRMAEKTFYVVDPDAPKPKRKASQS